MIRILSGVVAGIALTVTVQRTWRTAAVWLFSLGD